MEQRRQEKTDEDIREDPWDHNRSDHSKTDHMGNIRNNTINRANKASVTRVAVTPAAKSKKRRTI